MWKLRTQVRTMSLRGSICCSICVLYLLSLPSMNPATGSVYAHLPNSVPEDVEAAVSSAEAAYPAWSRLSHEARAPVLLRCVNIVKRL